MSNASYEPETATALALAQISDDPDMLNVAFAASRRVGLLVTHLARESVRERADAVRERYDDPDVKSRGTLDEFVGSMFEGVVHAWTYNDLNESDSDMLVAAICYSISHEDDETQRWQDAAGVLVLWDRQEEAAWVNIGYHASVEQYRIAVEKLMQLIQVHSDTGFLKLHSH